MRSSQSDSIKLTSNTLIECGSSRVGSRSVSWNSSGSFLAMACSDRVARIWTVDTAASSSANVGGNTGPTASVREVLTVSGHSAAVTKVRFHPKEQTLLATGAADKTVRLWDVRGASQRAMGRIDLLHGPGPVAVEWCGGSTGSILAVMERSGIYVFDIRKLSPSSISASTSRGAVGPTTGTAALYVFSPGSPSAVAEICIFTPDGKYLVADESMYGESYGYLRVWPWDANAHASTNVATATDHSSHDFLVPSNTPIYAMAFSPNAKFLATGGCDATVGVWETDSMCCTHTVARHSKFIRSVAFSHDSKILASSTEDGVDLANSKTGELIGLANLGARPKSGGAEEIAFHPSEYLLACARTDTPMGPPPTPMTVMKLSISEKQ